MATQQDPRKNAADSPNTPRKTALRTSETLSEKTAELSNKQTKPPEVDFRQLQARFG